MTVLTCYSADQPTGLHPCKVTLDGSTTRAGHRRARKGSVKLPDAAIEVLTGAGRRRDDRHDRLLHQIRYNRAELFERVGRNAQARRELEQPYAEAPEFEGLTERLGLS